MKRKIAGFLVRLAISAAFIGGISYLMRDKLGAAVQTLRHGVSWNWVCFGVLIYFFTQLCMASRFYLLLKIQKIKARFSDAFHLHITGLFFGLFLPSALGGDIAKGYYVAQSSGSKLKATTCIVQDRLIGLIAMVAMAGAALLFSSGSIAGPDAWRLLGGAIAAVSLLIFFFAHKPFAQKFKWFLHLVPAKKIHDTLAELYHAIHDFRNHKGALAACLTISWLGQALFVLVNYMISKSLGVSSSLGYYFLAVPVSCFFAMIPSLGGVGVREAGLLFFLNRIMAAEKALALSLLVSAVIYGFSLAGGIFFAIYGGPKKNN